MAKASIFDIKLDMSGVEGLATALSQVSSEDLGKAIVETLNDVGEGTYDLARGKMMAGINLTDDYLRSRMEFRKATQESPKVEIIAKGGNPFVTGLGHYGALQEAKDTRWETEDGPDMGYKIGPWPKWEPRRGDPARGLEPGEKAAGVSVEVKRGNRKVLKSAFTIPGKVHSDGSPVLFVGKGVPGKGKMDRNRAESRQGVESLYGPSVYQLFRFTANNIQGEVAQDLERAIVERAESEFLKVLK